MPGSPVEDHGLIGDTRCAALVTSEGAVDWMCVPRFDGPSVFGRLVGGPAAGTFRLGPARPAVLSARRYRPGSATLETTWTTAGGQLTLTEGMVAEVTGRLAPPTLLVRRLSVHGAPVPVEVEFDPRLGEHHLPPHGGRRGEALVCTWPGIALALHTDPPVTVEPGRPTTVVVTPGRPLTVAVTVADREPLVHVSPAAAWAALRTDEQRWRTWCQEVDPGLPFRDAVLRSLLTLRLLTYSPSGAPVAAPTTSLPEHPGGVRNWDYRYSWPRDASIGVGAFLGAGKAEEARRFVAWLLYATRLDRPRLPALFTLHGTRPPPERVLTGWPGHLRSRPVRVGNDAGDQHQLDGYGWVVDAAWQLSASGNRVPGEVVRTMAAFADTVAKRWRDPDSGIWEVRGHPAHHVHSKLMAWLALDRALRLSEGRRSSDRRRRRWETERDAVATEIFERGFDPVRGTLTRSYGSRDVDAALLVLPLLGLEPADSPRVRGTIEAIRGELGAGGPLLYRYPPGEDGLPGTEGAFLPCSFWLVHALAVSGRASEAAELLGELIEFGGPLGLYAEEMDPSSHHQLGNYPQALTHAALVQAALALRDRWPTGFENRE